jgi:hypothetical protein
VKIRFGTYTRYKGYDFRLLNNSDSYRLVFDGSVCPLPKFKKYSDNVFYLDLSKREVDNAFSVRTRGIYRSYQFDVNNINVENTIGIVTDNKNAFEDLKLEMRDRGVYQKEIKIIELDKLWEERSQTTLDLPLPKGLELMKEMDIPNALM